jgi:uncharacterized RDD family membrane protein YckC
MAKLIVNPTSSARREVALARTLLSIGRDPSNDVVLPDAMVSRRHAVIEYRGSQYYLRDCNSSNGSLVNGDRVSEKSLRDGDLVAIGTARLLFRDDLVIEDAAGKVVQHPSAPRVQCPSCQADYRKGDAFCRHCGGALAPSGPPRAVCTACGTAVLLPAHFCNACGTPLPSEGEVPETVKPTAAEGLVTAPRAEEKEKQTETAAEATPAATDPPPSAGPAAPEPAALVVPASDDPRPVASFAGSAARALAPSAPPSTRPARPAPAIPTPLRTPAASVRPETPARFGPRALAAVLDALLVAVGQAALLVPAGLYWGAQASPGEASFVSILLSLSLVAVAVLGGVFYYVHFWGMRGATPGKRWLGLAVEGVDGVQPIGLGRAALRVLAYGLSGAILGIGFLMAAFGGQALHDRIAGTRVVRRPRG